MPANTPKTETERERGSNPNRNTRRKKQDRKIIQDTCIIQGHVLSLLALNSTYVMLPSYSHTRSLLLMNRDCFISTFFFLFQLLTVFYAQSHSSLYIFFFLGGGSFSIFIITGYNFVTFVAFVSYLCYNLVTVTATNFFLRNFLETAAHGNPLNWKIFQAKCSSDDTGTHLNDLFKLNKAILLSSTKTPNVCLCSACVQLHLYALLNLTRMNEMRDSDVGKKNQHG